MLMTIMWISIALFAIFFLFPWIQRKYRWYSAYRKTKRLKRLIRRDFKKKGEKIPPKLEKDLDHLSDLLRGMYENEEL